VAEGVDFATAISPERAASHTRLGLHSLSDRSRRRLRWPNRRKCSSRDGRSAAARRSLTGPTPAVRRVTMPDQRPFAFGVQKSQATQGSMAMKMSFPIFLAIVGCMGGSYASTVDSPTSTVRVQRAESNAAKEHPATSTAAGRPPLAVTPTRNSKIRRSSRIDARRRPSSMLDQGSGLQKQGIGKVSGERQMEPCERRVCTLQCGFRPEALGA
jgi:hypothetical protein